MAASSAPRRADRRAVRFLVWALVALGLGAAYLFGTLPDTGRLRSGWPETTAYMRGWLADAGPGARLDYRPVPLSRIPQSVRRAVLVSEDAGFYGHSGFDWYEIRQALARAREDLGALRGASTITQQLARNLYLSPSRNPLRKLREALIARRLEATLSKDRILELYLSVIEFGRGVYGVEAAARRYFGVGIEAVGRRQAAMLAATIPSPKNNNPATATTAFRRRFERAHARAFGGASDEPAVTVAPPDSSDGAAGTDTSEITPPAAAPMPPDTAAAPPDTAPAPPDTTAAPPDAVPPSDTTRVMTLTERAVRGR